jgi:hypothetical protein
VLCRRAGDDDAGGGRWGWRRKLVAAVAVVALALGSGAAGAYAVTSMEGDTAVASSSGVTTSASASSGSSLASVAAEAEQSVVSITVHSTGQQVEGSGVILSSDGLIVPNYHVVEGASGGRITVKLSDGRTVAASVVGTDKATDLAVIQADGVSGLQAATFGDSDQLQVGDTVLAIGNPLGLEGSVTAGIVSALHRSLDGGNDGSGQDSVTISDAIQTDATINPGQLGWSTGQRRRRGRRHPHRQRLRRQRRRQHRGRVRDPQQPGHAGREPADRRRPVRRRKLWRELSGRRDRPCTRPARKHPIRPSPVPTVGGVLLDAAHALWPAGPGWIRAQRADPAR